MLRWDRTISVLKDYRDYVVSQSKRNLTANKMGGSVLKRKLRGVVRIAQDRDIKGRFTAGKVAELDFIMPFYGRFVDEGVKGTKDQDANRGAKPFKFDRNKKAINLKAAESFIQKKTGFRRMKKVSKKTLTFLIARAIHQKGIKRSLFFTKPLQKRYKGFLNKVNSSAADDITLEFVQRLKTYLNESKS